MASIVVDSYAWVEYSAGTSEGEKARRYIEGDHRLFTPAVVVAELSDRATRTGRRSEWSSVLYPYIRRNTTVVPLDAELAEHAGELKWAIRDSNPEAGLADVIVLATARAHEASVLTGYPDFLVPAFADEVIDVTGG